MSQPVGTVHLNISVDDALDGVNRQVRQVGEKAGRSFSDRFTAGLGRRLSKDMAEATSKASKAAEKAVRPLSLKVDAAGAESKMREFGARRRTISLTLEANQAQADAKIRAFVQKERALQVRVDAGDEKAQAELDALVAKRRVVEIQVEVQKARAEAQLAALDRRRAVNVDVDANTAVASANIAQLGAEAGRAGAGINAMVLAGASIGPVIVPAVAAATAGIIGLGTAVGSVVAAVGVGALAFSGIGDAVKALGEQQNKAVKSTGNLAAKSLALAGATDRVKQAQAGLANARANADVAAGRAVVQVENAERALATVQQRARDAQMGLTQARRDAAAALEDLQSRVQRGALSEREATLALTRAQEALKRAQIDPKATALDREEAALQVERATLNLEEQRKENQRVAEEKAQADKAGIKGSKQVADANARIRDTQEDVKEAERAIAAARASQAETARQSAYSIAQAQQGIVAAQRAVQAASVTTATVGTASTDKLRKAMEGLTPAGRTFARFIFSLRDEFKSLKGAAESALLPGIQRAIETLRPFLPAIERFVSAVGTAMATVAIRFAEAFAGPEFRGFFKYLSTSAPKVIERLGSIFLTMGQIFADIFVAAGPVGESLLASFDSFLSRVADFTSSKEGKAAIRDFFASAIPMLKSLAGLAGSIGNLFGAVLGASGPRFAGVIDSITNAINGFAEAIRGSRDSAGIIAGIAAALVGFKVIGTITKLVGAVGTQLKFLGAILRAAPVATAIRAIGAALAFAFGGPVGIAIGAITLLVGGLVYAYQNVESFRNGVNTATAFVAKVFTWLWRNAIQPAINGIAKLVTWLWHNVIVPAWAGIKLAIDIAAAAIKIAFGALQIQLKVIGAVFHWLWTKAVKPVMGWIGDKISTAWTKVIKPILDVLGSYITTDVAPKFRAAVESLGAIWATISEWAKAPIRFIVETVINEGIIGTFNKVADIFGVSKVAPVQLPTGLQAAKPAEESRPGRIGGIGDGPGASAGSMRKPPPSLSKALQRRKPGTGDLIDVLRGARDRATDAIAGVGNLLQDPAGAIRSLTAKLLSGFPQDSFLGKLMAALPTKISDLLGGQLGNLFTGGGQEGAEGAVPSGGLGWQRMMEVLRGAFPGLPLNSGFRPGSITATGNLSYHARGRAVDVPPRMDVFNWIRENFPNSRELIFSPAGNRQIHNGKPYTYTGVTKSMHYDHVHWAYDQGGWLQPGRSVVQNNTGKPEAVFTSQQWGLLEKNLRAGQRSGSTHNYYMTRQSDAELARDIRGIQQRDDLLASLTGS